MNSGHSKFKLLSSLVLGVALFVSAGIPASAQWASGSVQQLCAPIALYPDPLLSNILAASTYPDEVVAAARWSQQMGPIAPSNINSALANQGWEPSVKSLVAFPEVLNYMADNMAWTVNLGNAFLSQGPDVFDAIQSLRLQAQSSGNLGSGNQQMVSNVNGAIVIEPTNPNRIYVPRYNSNQIYSQQQPIGLAIAFGLGILVDRFLWTGVPAWNQDRIYFGQGYNSYYQGSGNYNTTYYNNVRNRVGNNQGAWKFNSQHRGSRAVPTTTFISPGRGYDNYRLPARPVIQQPIYNRPTPNQRPNLQSPIGPRRPNSQLPAGQSPVRTVPGVPTQVRTSPRPSNVPGSYNVRPGARVNQESTRGAQSRNQTRPTQVAPVNRPNPPGQNRPAPGRSQNNPPGQNRNSPNGNRGQRK